MVFSDGEDDGFIGVEVSSGGKNTQKSCFNNFLVLPQGQNLDNNSSNMDSDIINQFDTPIKAQYFNKLHQSHGVKKSLENEMFVKPSKSFMIKEDDV